MPIEFLVVCDTGFERKVYIVPGIPASF